MVGAFSYPESDQPALAMTTLPIPVDEATAAAFQKVPADEQEEITRFLADYVRVKMRSRGQTKKERLDAFRRAADALSASAQANGWTEEMNEALLRGDFDDDE